MIDPPSASEVTILREIEAALGFEWPRIQTLSMLPLNQYIAAMECVIPWVPQADESIRAAIYVAFDRKEAAGYMPMLLAWRASETDPVALSFLLQVIRRLITTKNAQSVFESIDTRDPRIEEIWLLGRLTGISATSKPAIDALLQLVATGKLPHACWPDVARLRHPAIRSWLDQHRAEFVWRADIRRALGETVALPPGASRTRREPRLDSTVERFDTDVQDIAAVIKSLEQKHMIRFPSGFAPTDVPMWLSEGSWVRLPALASGFELLLRQEDWSTIELALVRTKPTKSTKVLGAYPACSDAKLAPSKEE